MYIVYGKDNCPYCVAAVELLNSMGVAYEYKNAIEYIELEPLKTYKEAGRLKTNNTGSITVPIIFENNFYIGGYDELYVYINGVDTGDDLNYCIDLEDL